MSCEWFCISWDLCVNEFVHSKAEYTIIIVVKFLLSLWQWKLAKIEIGNTRLQSLVRNCHDYMNRCMIHHFLMTLCQIHHVYQHLMDQTLFLDGHEMYCFIYLKWNTSLVSHSNHYVRKANKCRWPQYQILVKMQQYKWNIQEKHKLRPNNFFLRCLKMQKTCCFPKTVVIRLMSVCNDTHQKQKDQF